MKTKIAALALAARTLALSALVLAPGIGRAATAAAGAAGATERLGTVSFAVDCAPAVRGGFDRGVALLHDFWYEEARPQFETIARADPGCAMAHWGIAMSEFHQIWDRPDAEALQDGWAQMQEAQRIGAHSQRERAYIDALSDFYRPGARPYQQRLDAYARAMGRLYAKYADDVDAGAFYALALLAAQPPRDPSLTAQRHAMAVLEPLWARYRDHPGLVHYIIHACDNPAMAHQGLAAARHYGEIAPSGPHAVHMPGHIFARLGMWQEDIAVNRASVAASQVAEARHQSGAMDQFHADDFLVYAYLQSGQEGRAREVLEQALSAMAHYAAMPDMHPEHYMQGMFPYYRMKLPIFLGLEQHDWAAAARLLPVEGAPPETQLQVYWARAVAHGHLHQVHEASADLAAYDRLLEQLRSGPQAYVTESLGTRIQWGEIAGWIAFAQGRIDEATERLRASANLQDRVGQGEVDIPAREMLGDVLLEAGRAQDALAEYRRVLQLSPNRFNALFNAGRAAELSGHALEARGFYAALLKSTDNGAHSTRAELAHAKGVVAAASLSQLTR